MFFFFKQKTAYELRISDWSSDVCSSDLAALSKRGVPVFNAPGANANAVKELVLASLLLAARNIPAALEFVRKLDGDDKAMHEAVEAGKKKFVGFELPGRTLGVIGLGAIGVKVANAALELGMNFRSEERRVGKEGGDTWK